jgi:hypothetical protein
MFIFESSITIFVFFIWPYYHNIFVTSITLITSISCVTNITISSFLNHSPLVICYIAIENGHRNSGFTH